MTPPIHVGLAQYHKTAGGAVSHNSLGVLEVNLGSLRHILGPTLDMIHL